MHRAHTQEGPGKRPFWKPRLWGATAAALTWWGAVPQGAAAVFYVGVGAIFRPVMVLPGRSAVARRGEAL